MLSAAQGSMVRTLRNGKSGVWVADRQEGKTYLGHFVADLYHSTVYISPSWMMNKRKKATYGDRHGITYLSADERHTVSGQEFSGFGLIVVDDFDFIPEWVWPFVLEQVGRTQILAMASRWQNLFVPTKEPSRSNQLNELVMSLSGLRFDTILPK